MAPSTTPPSRPGKDADPRAVYDYAQAVLAGGDSDGWVDMFAEDGVMEIPLAPAGVSNRFVGRDAIRAFLKPIQQTAFQKYKTTATDHVFHVTDRAVVHEFVSNIEDPATGQIFRAPYVHVVTVENGEYVSFHDYANFALMPPAVMPWVTEKLTSP